MRYLCYAFFDISLAVIVAFLLVIVLEAVR